MTSALDPTSPELAGDRLTAARGDAMARLEAVERRVEDLRRERADEPADDEHDPDGPTLSSEWTMAQAQREVVEAALVEIDAAMERLRAGSYGFCISCGRPIPSARLEARPAAPTCLDCADSGRSHR